MPQALDPKGGVKMTPPPWGPAHMPQGLQPKNRPFHSEISPAIVIC
jgi:hypothetical protein